MTTPRRRRRWLPVAAAVSMVGLGLGAAAPAASAAGSGTPVTLSMTQSQVPMNKVGTVDLGSLPSPSGDTGTPTTGNFSHGKPLGRPHNAGSHGKPIFAGHGTSVVAGNVAGESGFEGVTGPQSASVNVPPPGLTPFSDVEPPDQGTCAGPAADGQPITFDFVNDALEAYGPGGTVDLGLTPAYQLFDQGPTAFLSDPRCYYDAPTGRWFFTMFVVGNTATYGATVTPDEYSTQFVAVSQSGDPLGKYTVFSFDTTDVGNPLGDCPCFGDFDMIGADANGFYITTNEFSNTTGVPSSDPYYNGTVLYALPKQALEAAAGGGPLPAIDRYAVTGDAYGYSAVAAGSTPAQSNGPYHVSPASTPPGGTYAPDTEYFVESNSDAYSDNHLIVYALTGTNELGTGTFPTLSATEISSEAYAFPPNAVQRNGPLPLGATYGYHRQAPTLQADFNAVQQTTYTAGHLYGELDTATVTTADSGRDGVAWFDVTPSASGSAVSASVAGQGYVATRGSLLYPDLVVDGAGHGYIDFAVTGPSMYPSAGYVAFDGRPTGPIHVAAAGAAPEDGFTCYPPFSDPLTGCRWGDYSAGAVWNGRVYMMTEYIPPSARDTETNWGTFVWSAPVP